MRVRHRFSMVILPLILLCLSAAIISCASAEAGPRAWIDWPTEGFETDVGTTVTVIAHAYAQPGVGEVRLEVDRQPYRVATPDLAGEQFVDVSMEWFADEPGIYLLSVTSFDVNGQASSPASVSVRVTGEGPELIIIPEPEGTPPPASATPEEPAATAAASETAPPPTATSPPPATGTPLPPTATPPPPTAPPEAPRITSFEVSRSQISVGECVRFDWRVEGSPTAIYFDGEGVTSPASMDVCPPATRDYQLRAVGPGGEDTESLTVVVIQPSPTPKDTQGPPAPSVVSPTGGIEVDCDDVELDWNPVTDPSGIDIYYVKAEKETSPGTWQSAGGWTATDTQVTVSLECGLSYRWEVRAEDGAGNVGPWSSWGTFSVTLT